MDEPSKPTPSVKLSGSSALGGTEKCCHKPGRSAKRRSIISTLSSLTILRTSWGVLKLYGIGAPSITSGSRSDRTPASIAESPVKVIARILGSLRLRPKGERSEILPRNVVAVGWAVTRAKPVHTYQFALERSGSLDCILRPRRQLEVVP